MEPWPPFRSNLLRRGLIAAGLALVVLVVFGRVAGFEFVTWDDPQHVLLNPAVNPPSWHGFVKLWEQPYWGLYVPISYSFFSAEAALSLWLFPQRGGLEPGIFHLGNLLLHLACVLLAFDVLLRLLARLGGESAEARRRYDLSAAAGALLLAIHPLQVESVAWISEARGLLCGLFSLAAISLYLRFTENGSRRWIFYALATLAMLLALLAKPAAVALPFMVAVIDRGVLRRTWRQMATALGPWLALAVGFGLLTRSEQPAGLMPFVAPLWTRPLVAADALAFYLGKLFAPLGLGPDYGRSPAWLLDTPRAWLIAGGALLGTVLLLAISRERRVWFTAAALSVAWFLPVLGLIPFDFQRVSTVADRYAYLAMLGPALALGWAIETWKSRWMATAVAAGLTILAGLALVQTNYWRNTATLMTHAAEVNPQSVVAPFHRGLLLTRAGKADEAITVYRESLAAHPEFVELYVELGNRLADAGRTEEAIQILDQAAQRHPLWAPVHNNLANLLAEAGKKNEAEAHFREAIALDPNYAAPYAGLGKILFERGKMEAGMRACNRALELEPNYALAHLYLGAAYAACGQQDESREHYRAAAALDPSLVPVLPRD